MRLLATVVLQLSNTFVPSNTTCDECFPGIHHSCLRMGCLSHPFCQAAPKQLKAKHGPVPARAMAAYCLSQMCDHVPVHVQLPSWQNKLKLSQSFWHLLFQVLQMLF